MSRQRRGSRLRTPDPGLRTLDSGLRTRLAADLAAAGCAPLHRLGQNFMVDGDALRLLAEEAGAGPGVRALEIGPGTGHLTTVLLDAGCSVLAVELDAGLVRHLEATLVPRGLVLVHGDCLASKSRLHPAIEAFAAAGEWVLCANLPYDAAIPALLNALALPRPPRRIAATVQLEAARRLCSAPGDDAWGASAAVVRACAAARIARRLPPACFQPQPRVDSAILVLEPRGPLPAGFGSWCRRVFAGRRKVLPGALLDAAKAAGTPFTRPQVEDACRRCGLDPSRRLEGLDADELLSLAAALPLTATDTP